ncbi:MAG: hypothetical protein JW943_09175 [Deltaproteobacteria bacterium]|nr:hypothetical protein [Deltaproteobacteria bacterium]
MKIRKQVYELTTCDLDQFPVWEFTLDEEGEEDQDEATVKPRKFGEPVSPQEGMFIVKASFTLANGKKFTGYLTPPVGGDSSMGTLQPNIVTDHGQVGFWCGILKPPQDYLRTQYQILGIQNPSDVFPIRYESEFPVSSGKISGQLTGFMYLADEKKGFFSKKRQVVREIQ